MKYLIVGLGNPGSEYATTRHNIGFMVIDHIAAQNNLSLKPDRYGDVVEWGYAGRKMRLLKPNTYMNLSGSAVRYWANKEKIAMANILVITDDIALPTAKLRLRGNGSDGGHNGLKSINEVMQSTAYPRLRFGVGNDFAKGQQADYVLGNFKHEELLAVQESITKTMDAVKSLVRHGLAMTMTNFNK